MTTVHRSATTVGRLLEREDALAALHGAYSEAKAGSGRLMFVSGEAGIGKTALVRAFSAGVGHTSRILEGSCDPLFAPRPLGPFADIAADVGGALAALVEEGAGARHVLEALRSELNDSSTVVVIEDLHWADEATLDVLRTLGRRMESIPALVLATYRDDELDRVHPLQIVLGELATARGVTRLRLEPLSSSAVAELAAGSEIDAAELYRKTSGNPFYVNQVLEAGGNEIPPTVRDAVLARTAGLSAAAVAVVEAAAAAPPHLETWLVEAVCGDAVDATAECLASGLLVALDNGISFRHELARIAIEDQLTPTRRVALHRLVLAALSVPPTGMPDLARLAHHAEAAADKDAVLRFAPAAAEYAKSLGAHREAGAQYGRALRFSEGMADEERAELLERRSFECFLTGQADEAIASLQQALESYRKLGDRRKEGAALCSLARRLGCAGRIAESNQAARDAVALLEQLPPGLELAMAYGLASAICMGQEDEEGTLAWGSRALELAQRLDDTEILVYALNNIGTRMLLSGKPEGREKLERSLELARHAGLEDHAGRAFIHIGWVLTRNRAYALDGLLEEGIEYCSEHGLDLWWLYLLYYRARSQLDRGRWDEAAESIAFVLRIPHEDPPLRTLALVALGLIRARRGDPDVESPLDEAFALAEASGELQALFEVALARAEAAWLVGNRESAVAATEAAFEAALRTHAPWIVGALAYWRWRAGIREEIPPGAAEPYIAQMTGDWTRAAELWTDLGCPYEAALALSETDEDGALRRALDESQRLGARPLATMVARRLRELGVNDVPRGPRPSTRENPAQLTSREIQILHLVADGLRNAEIAERLFLSRRTVDHHVSAILRKLGARSRGEAVAAARRFDLLQDR